MRDALATAGDLTTEVLRDVRELARGARAADCELWYWWSL
jgi:hypothetical protein